MWTFDQKLISRNCFPEKLFSEMISNWNFLELRVEWPGIERSRSVNKFKIFIEFFQATILLILQIFCFSTRANLKWSVFGRFTNQNGRKVGKSLILLLCKPRISDMASSGVDSLAFTPPNYRFLSYKLTKRFKPQNNHDCWS